MRSDQMGGSGLSIASSNLGQGGGAYGYPQQGQMWPPSQAQQSPQHQFPTYNPHGGQQSPHLQQSPQHPPPQLRHSGSNPQMQPALQYPGMRGLGQGYPAPGQGLYPGQSAQQYMQATTAGPQPGAESWAPQQQAQSGQPWGGWTGQQQ